MAQRHETDVEGYDWFQRGNKGIEAGDVFSVPLVVGGYGFGRVMNAHEGATLAEFFRYWKDTPDYDDAMAVSGRLFPPVGFLIADIAYRNRKRPWRVIHKEPDYYPDDLYDIPFAQSHDGRNWTCYTLRDIRKTLGPVSGKDVNAWRVSSRLPQHSEQIRSTIERYLKSGKLMPA